MRFPSARFLANPVTVGSFVGAVVGKPIGIIWVTWLLVKIKSAELPKGMDWVQVVGVGIMGGLGFTMSILIAALAFSDASLVLAAKVAILAASVTSGVLGCVFMLAMTAIRNTGAKKPETAEA